MLARRASDDDLLACREAIACGDGRYEHVVVRPSPACAEPASRIAGLPASVGFPSRPGLTGRRLLASLAGPDTLIQTWGLSADRLVAQTLPRHRRTLGLTRPPEPNAPGVAFPWSRLGAPASVFSLGRALAAPWARALGREVASIDAPGSPDIAASLAPGRVIGLIGGREGGPDLRWFAFRIGVLNVAGMPARGLAPAWGVNRERSLRFVRLQRGRLRLDLLDAGADGVLTRCDAVVAAPGSGPSVYRLAAGAGLPVVGTGTRSVGEALRPDPETLLARRPDSPRMIWVLANLLEGRDPDERPNGAPAAPAPSRGAARSVVDVWDNAWGRA